MNGYEAIPLELRARDQWVTWRFETRDGNRTKVPYSAVDGARASTTDPATWSSFDGAVSATDWLAMDGIGFVFAVDDPFVGVDLDAGMSEADRGAIILALDSYTEESVSGRGAHVIARASLSGHSRRRKGPLEVYDQHRYFVVTGAHVRGMPTTIEERQAELDEVLAEFLPTATPIGVASRPPVTPIDVTDEELLTRAIAAKHGVEFEALWRGRWEDRYGSQSEADLALAGRLAFWTGRDPGRIDRMFRSSGLMREKWERDDYRERTIAAAVTATTEVYEPRQKHLSPRPHPESENGSTDSKAPVPEIAARQLRTIRGDEIAMRSIEWLDKPLLQGSAFHLVAGPKGVGKGTWLARKIADTTHGRLGPKTNVLIVASEDSATIDLKPRLVAAGADHTRWHLVIEELMLPRDLVRLEQLARSFGDVGLIVLDPVGNHLGGVDTDREGLVRHAIGGLNRLADELACMILGVRHLAKMRVHGALAAVLGSTAWVDVPRAVLAFARDDEDDMIFHVQVVAGNRSGRTAAHGYRIELREIGLKEPVTCAVSIGESTKSVDDLLAAPRHESKSKSANARELILDILETDGEQESDALDARAAAATGLNARTVRNLRGELARAGLIKSVPESDELFGAVASWKVVRTQAPRPGSEVHE